MNRSHGCPWCTSECDHEDEIDNLEECVNDKKDDTMNRTFSNFRKIVTLELKENRI